MKNKFIQSLVVSFALFMLAVSGAVFAGSDNDNKGSKKEVAADDKVLICHKMKKTDDDCFFIEVSTSAGGVLAAHARHGDLICDPNPLIPPLPGCQQDE